MEVDHDLFEAIQNKYTEQVKFALDTDDKNVREERLQPIKDAIHAEFDEQYPDKVAMIDECIYKLQKFIVRRWLLDEQKRVDGRGMDEIRPLAAEVVTSCPRVHGSGLFTRGQTQVLTIYDPRSRKSTAQKLDGLDEDRDLKRYMHHYNFPVVLGRRNQANPRPRHAARSVTAHLRRERSGPCAPARRGVPLRDTYSYLKLLASNGSTAQA